jgi:drug/metabolite transporter (DMT)-like permease
LRGFSAGRMGIVAPVSAVLAAAIPVIFSAFTEGLPRLLQVASFGLGLSSIWLLARPEKLGGRLDVAALLGSFYPAVTAILAWLISREQMARLQVFGVALAVIAIMLITI